MHEQIETLIRQAEEKLAPAFKRLEAIEESGTRRVLDGLSGASGGLSSLCAYHGLWL